MSQGLITLQGLSGFCDDAYANVQNKSMSPMNPLKQVSALNLLACRAFVGGYAQVNYGTITNPERILAKLPPPVAPRTEEEMKTWNPEMMDTANAAAFEKWKQEARDLIAADEAAGTYDPEGNLPFDMEFLNKYKWYLAAGALALVVILKPKERY